MLKTLEFYCRHLFDFPEAILSVVQDKEDVIVLRYDTKDNCNIVAAWAGEVFGDGFGGEYIDNVRKLDLDYPISPTLHLYNMLSTTTV